MKNRGDSKHWTKNKDLLVILLWPLVASFLSIVFKANYLTSIVWFLFLPAAYLSWRNPKYIKKIALFSAVLGIPLAIVYDYILEVTGTWFTTASVFGAYRLFGSVMVEDVLWLFLWIYFIAIFYETFLDKKVTPKLYQPNMKYLAIAVIALLSLFIFLYFLSPATLEIEYFYTKVSILTALIPVALMIFEFPFLASRFIKAGSYFFIFSLIYEITALHLDLWRFPSENQFIGFVSLFGVAFPFEELFYWMILGAVTIITYYEFFDDDKK